MNNLTRKQRKMLYRILAAAALLIAVKLLPNLFPVPRWTAIPLYLISYLIIGWDVLWKAVRNILNGQVFDENFLMASAYSPVAKAPTVARAMRKFSSKIWPFRMLRTAFHRMSQPMIP